MSSRAAAPRSPVRGVRFGAVLALSAGIAFIVWLFVVGGNGNSSSPSTATQQPTAVEDLGTGPKAASRAGLHALSVSLAHPIYWAGPQANHTYELTRTSSGRIFIRYLPRGVPVGIRRALFTIVGTYPVPNALNVLKNLAKKSGEKQLPVPRGGFAVYKSSQPTNVYVAYPGSNLQIEVFDPSAPRARRLVTSGRVASVR